MTSPDSSSSAIDLDLCGLICPLPVLKTAKALKRLKAGQRLVVAATDPLAGLDIPNFCREHGHALLEQAREGGEMRFTIEKGRRTD